MEKNDNFSGKKCRKVHEYQATVLNNYSKLPGISRKFLRPLTSEKTTFTGLEEPSCSGSSNSSLTSSSSSVTSLISEYSLENLHMKTDDEWKKQQVFASRWETETILDTSVCDNAIGLVTRIKLLDDTELNKTSTLEDKTVGVCMTNLAKTPDTNLCARTKCELIDMNLRDISVLTHHRHLRYIDLTLNRISDLSPLGGLSYLTYLNLSKNELTNVLRFAPPLYLTYVNLSHNKIAKIDDLSQFWSIVKLDLSHNAIEHIEGLKNLRYLRYLDLSHNMIQSIENLDNLNIEELNMEYNCVTRFVSLKPPYTVCVLPELRILILGHNKLSRLHFFEGSYGLHYVDLKYNKIADILEVFHLECSLYEVDFRGNPCTKCLNYPLTVLYSMPSLIVIDGVKVSMSEKVLANTIYTPPQELLATRNVTKLLVLENLNSPNIDQHVMPIDQRNVPLIMLTAPLGVQTAMLARRAAEQLVDKVRYCKSHTTQSPKNSIHEISTYHHVSQESFNEMAKRGEFLAVEEFSGNSYGFHSSELRAIVHEKKVGIAHMNLHAAMQMQGRYVNAKIILVLATSEKSHEKRILEKSETIRSITDCGENPMAINVAKCKKSRRINTLNFGNEVAEKLELKTVTKVIKVCDSHKHTDPPCENLNQTQPSKVAIDAMSLTDISIDSQGELKVIFDEGSNMIREGEIDECSECTLRTLLGRDIFMARKSGSNSVDDIDWEKVSCSNNGNICKPYMYERNSHADAILDTASPLEIIHDKAKLALRSTENYLKHHIENPGFYAMVIFTDDVTKAFDQLVHFIREFYAAQPSRKPIFHEEMEVLTNKMNVMKTETFDKILTR